jgi:hypothetical protein
MREECVLEAVLDGVHQRRRRDAGAILGERSHSMSGSFVLLRLSILCARIFTNPTPGGNASDVPSGMFPGGDDGARRWWFQIGGGDQVPDRVFANRSRVLVVKSQSCVVFSFSSRGLLVTLYRPFV